MIKPLIFIAGIKEPFMEVRAMLLAAVLGSAVAGCTGSTAVSTQPSQAQIQQGIDRRIADVDKITGLSDEQKERMKSQIRGSQAGR
jgi:hypothetical protein